jgi:hypothetical protein
MGYPSRAKNALCCRGSIDYVRGTRAGRVSFARAERAGRSASWARSGSRWSVPTARYRAAGLAALRPRQPQQRALCERCASAT